jgi:hypothetical protein
MLDRIGSLIDCMKDCFVAFSIGIVDVKARKLRMIK